MSKKKRYEQIFINRKKSIFSKTAKPMLMAKIYVI